MKNIHVRFIRMIFILTAQFRKRKGKNKGKG